MDTIRAWKDPAYRQELVESGIDVPAHPSGMPGVTSLELSDLTDAAGGWWTQSCTVWTVVSISACAATFALGC